MASGRRGQIEHSIAAAARTCCGADRRVVGVGRARRLDVELDHVGARPPGAASGLESSGYPATVAQAKRGGSRLALRRNGDEGRSGRAAVCVDRPEHIGTCSQASPPDSASQECRSCSTLLQACRIRGQEVVVIRANRKPAFPSVCRSTWVGGAGVCVGAGAVVGGAGGWGGAGQEAH